MSQMYDSIRGQINQEMISKASELLGEKDSNVSKATSSIVAGLLAVLLKKGNTQQISNILEEAGNLNTFGDKAAPFEDRPTQNQQRLGDEFLQHLLGDKAVDFSMPIANQHGISEVAVNRLVSMVSPVVVGYLGHKMVKENMNLSLLMKTLDNENLKNNIPAGIISAFGLGNLSSNSNNITSIKEKKKKNNGWILWLILILLLLLIFFLWRSCRKTSPEVYQERPVPTVTEATNSTSMNTAERKSTVVTLPNGVKLQAYMDGIEEKMIEFLQSNEYKNANGDDLKNKWFIFDNIRFEFDSPSKLMAGSQNQVNNIIEILKYFKDAKVRIAGFADKVGSEDVNMEISKERAKTIEKLLEDGGVGNQVVRTEGFGEEYATHSASASDAERSKDRDIALRFVK